MSGFVFDGITVELAGVVVATIDRPKGGGPLENGRYDGGGNWVPSSKPTRVRAIGFGIDALGNPYFNTTGASPGEAAELWVDATSGLVWLQR